MAWASQQVEVACRQRPATARMSQQQQQQVVAASASAQTMRDTKRILQVLLPGLTGPALDLCANTIFASTTASQAQRRRSSSGGGHFKLRRMDSGALGEFDIFYPIGRKPSQRFMNVANLKFDYQPPAPEPAAAGKRTQRAT